MPSIVPNFFILGFQKCGTTTLHQLLKQHPECFMPEDKEPMALAYRDFQPGLYLPLLRPAIGKGYKAVGEASTAYLAVDHVGARIREHIGHNVRFIVIVRDPVQRALSAYLHMYKRGHEHRDWNAVFGRLDGEAAQAAQQEELALGRAAEVGEIFIEPYRRLYGPDASWNYRYVNGSRYAHLLEPYLQAFPRENFLFLQLDELERSPASVVHKMFRFLNLSSNFQPDRAGRRANQTQVGRPLPPLAPETRARLQSILQPEAEMLRSLLDLELLSPEPPARSVSRAYRLKRSSDGERWQNRVQIVIRACGELTIPLCRELIARQGFTDDEMLQVGQKPFPHTLADSLQAGIQAARDWTLCIDADVLPLEGSIASLLREADRLPSDCFEMQPVVFDRLFGGWRPAGTHLYRTAYLPDAACLLLALPSSQRPETQLIEAMAERGYPYEQSSLRFGLHDYWQSPLDVFRKAYTHAHKHSAFIPRLIAYWRQRAVEPDFRVALQGLSAGIARDADVVLDASDPELLRAASIVELHAARLPALDANVAGLLETELLLLRAMGYATPPVWDWEESARRERTRAERGAIDLVLDLIELGLLRCCVAGRSRIENVFRSVARAHGLQVSDLGSEAHDAPLVEATEGKLRLAACFNENRQRVSAPRAGSGALSCAANHLVERLARAGHDAVLVFGAGEGGRLVARAAKQRGISVLAFLQTNPNGQRAVGDEQALDVERGLARFAKIPVAVASLTHRAEMLGTLARHLSAEEAPPTPIFAIREEQHP